MKYLKKIMILSDLPSVEMTYRSQYY